MFAKIKIYFSFASVAWYLSIYLVIIFFRPSKVVSIRKWASRKILSLNGIHIEVQGTIDNSTQLFLLNHQSMLDIMVLESIYDKDIAWVAKKELFDIFILGKTLRVSNSIAVDRQNKKGLKTLLEKAKKRVDQGVTLAMFPEGTRGKTHKLLPFKPGSMFVANTLNLTVQPIVIGNTKHLFNLKKMQMYSGTIHVRVLPSFDITKQSPKTWLEDLRTTMQSTFDEL